MPLLASSSRLAQSCSASRGQGPARRAVRVCASVTAEKAALDLGKASGERRRWAVSRVSRTCAVLGRSAALIAPPAPTTRAYSL
jgi:hypothetical protein